MKKIPKLDTDSAIAVVWNDIKSDCSWNTPEQLKNTKPSEVKTLGFFDHADKKNLVVKHSLADDGQADFTIIPIGCITRIRKLQIKE